MRFWSGSARCSTVCAALVGLHVLPAQAAPITVELTRRLTEVCDTLPANVGTCIPDNTRVRFGVTYDPDTLVLDVSRPGHVELTTGGPLSYTISLQPFEDPWGGAIEREAHVRAEFDGNPLGLRRAFHVQILDSDLSPGCTPDGKCDRGWLTVLELGNFFSGPPVGVPGVEDFERMFHHSGGGESVFSFLTVAWYTPIGTMGRVYLPESRLYYSAVPEPSITMLIPMALIAFALRRGRRVC